METIKGALFSGFMCKVYAGAMGLWMASEAVSYFAKAMAQVTAGFGG